MKTKFQIHLVALVCFSIQLHTAHTQTPVEDSIFIVNNYRKLEQRIAMRDGMKLFTAIYLPKDAGPAQRYPILMERTPYSVEPYGANKLPKHLGPNPFLLRSKYIFVYQDVRGRYMSEGVFEEMTPHKSGVGTTSESSDTYDTVKWLLENIEGNNGRVGIWGISYPGFYATASLPDSHPAIKAVSPQAPVTDEFMGDDVNHNGAFFLMDNFFFTNYFDATRDSITTDYEPLGKFKVKDAYEYFLKMGPIKNAGKRCFKDAKIWHEYLANDTYSRYWAERNIRPHLKDVKPATLVVGGWFDAEDLFGALNTYRAIEQQSPGSENFLVMGPWTHGAWASRDWSKFASYDFGENTARYFQEKVETPFFNHYLKDEGEFTLPEALLFETGTNTWKSYDQFPPKNAKETVLYFQPDKGLSFEKSNAAGSADKYISDPAKPVPYLPGKLPDRDNTYMAADQRFAAARPDVLVYETEVLTENLSLTGPVTAELYVTTTGTDADFVVKLIDVLPAGEPNADEGFQRLVRAEVMRGKFRESFENPQPFTTGYVTKVAFQMPDVAHTFKKGHRLMVQIQSSWFPLVDRNPQVFMRIPEAEKEDFKRADIRVFHDAEHPSQVRLRVVK